MVSKLIKLKRDEEKDRRRRLVERALKKKNAQVKEVAELFNVSPSTIYKIIAHVR